MSAKKIIIDIIMTMATAIIVIIMIMIILKIISMTALTPSLKMPKPQHGNPLKLRRKIYSHKVFGDTGTR